MFHAAPDSVFFVFFCRDVVDIADNGVLGFFPGKSSPFGRRSLTTRLGWTTSGKFASDNHAEICPITSSRYVVFVGRDVCHTESRHVHIHFHLRVKEVNAFQCSFSSFLVNDIARNQLKNYNSTAEAVSAYVEAERKEIVRRVIRKLQSSGEV